MTTYLFTGALITREPLAYSPPDHSGPDERSLLPRMVVPSAAGALETVFLSGANIRGKLRHACADVWLERERTVTLRRFLECKVGGVKGRGAEVRVGLTARAAYLDGDPFLSLFGAGSSPIGWIHSRLDVGAALPDEPTQPILVKGVRSDATTDPMLLKVLDPHERPAVLEGQAANRSRSQAAAERRELTRRIRQEKKAKHDTTELERALDAAHQAEQEAVRTQSKLLGSDVSLQMPLPGYEAIPPGTVLNHRMFLKHVVEEQTALLMGGLERFAEDPRFGARRAQGCGRVSVAYEVKRIDGTHAHPVGTVSIDPDRWDADASSLELSGEPERWLGKWREGLK